MPKPMYRSTLTAVALAAAALGGPAFAQLKAPSSAGGKPAPAAAASPAPAASASTSPEAAEKEAAGRVAAAGWLSLLDRRDWGTAWETSSAVFRGAVPLARWMDAVPKVRTDLGALVERTPTESVYRTELEGRPPGDYVSVVFTSKFEQREIEEVVTTVREPDGRWRVTGYLTR